MLSVYQHIVWVKSSLLVLSIELRLRLYLTIAYHYFFDFTFPNSCHPMILSNLNVVGKLRHSCQFTFG
jgi:hypothetical protein